MTAVRQWAAGRVPHERARGRIVARVAPTREVDPLTEEERAAHEAAMTENMLLRAVLDDLKAGGSPAPSISNRRRAELGERLRAATGLPLREVTRFLGISRSSYEYRRAGLGRDRHAGPHAEAREAFEAGRGAYGYRRVHAELRRRGRRVSEKVVRRLMREEGLAAARPRRRRYSPYAGEEGRAPAPNLLLADAERDLHDFAAARPGEVLATDITEFGLPCGAKVHLSPCVDPFDGDVASLAVGTSPGKALVSEMLEGAVAATGGGFTLHSDRGWHYRTPDWVAACAAAGVTRSMSRRGHSPDNAAMEGFFGRLKVEFFHGRDWPGVSPGEFAAALEEHVRWHREGRLKAFREGGRTVYDTIAGRRRRLGLAV